MSAKAGKMLVSLEKLRLIIYKKQTRLPSPFSVAELLRRVKVYGGQDLKQAKRIL
jgi:hypothetical protein